MHVKSHTDKEKYQTLAYNCQKTLVHYFSNCGTRTATATQTTVYGYTAL